jgi:hypothetical protein
MLLWLKPWTRDMDLEYWKNILRREFPDVALKISHLIASMTHRLHITANRWMNAMHGRPFLSELQSIVGYVMLPVNIWDMLWLTLETVHVV